MRQLTLEDAEREAHVTRLSCSLERWRAGGLDQILPDEYARFCGVLAHLQAGGGYTVNTFDPREGLRSGHGCPAPGETAAIVREMGRGLAGISRHWRIGFYRERK